MPERSNTGIKDYMGIKIGAEWSLGCAVMGTLPGKNHGRVDHSVKIQYGPCKRIPKSTLCEGFYPVQERGKGALWIGVLHECCNYGSKELYWPHIKFKTHFSFFMLLVIFFQCGNVIRKL